MFPAHHRPQMRRALSLVLLVAVLGVGSLTLTQCRMIADRVVGVDVLNNRPTDCFRQCKEDFATATANETRLHWDNLRACGRDQACINAENTRYFAALRTLFTNLQHCLNDCHHQGGGDGGDR
jgi:hypothetical protein